VLDLEVNTIINYTVRIREFGVFSETDSHKEQPKELSNMNAKGIIFLQVTDECID